MIYFLVSFGLCLHILLWGAGLAILVTPSRWRNFWPIWMAPAGVALQSTVVWLGAHTGLAGTNIYGWGCELIPLGLLYVGFRKIGSAAALRALIKLKGLWLVMAVCLTLLTLPLAQAGRGLNTLSLGSCDAADYAAGARVLQEFARTDRGGFMGLTEVVQVGSTDNFFDFWLTLNHFSPSALIALNGTIMGLAPHQLTGLMTVVLLVLVQPMVFWLARTTIGMGRMASLWLGLLYGLSPIAWYAAYHVAPAQLMAAQGIGLITWVGFALWRDRMCSRAGLSYFGLLLIGFSILWGGYNFIIVVSLVPAVACVGGWALASSSPSDFWRWLRRMLVPLALAGLIYYERVLGLAERFLLFQTIDFGWKIAPLMPEGWYGVVADTGLNSWNSPWAWGLSGILLGALALAWFRLVTRSGREAWRILALTIPVLIGYAFLQWRGWKLGNNASYDAYKLFAVFYPVLLVALCPWLTWLRERSPLRYAAVGLATCLTMGNGFALQQFSSRMAKGLLIVEPELVEVQQIEAMPEVTSVNMLIPDIWERLWANAFLLRRPQYFVTHSYEGRLDSKLKGEWDLNGGLVQVKLPDPDYVKINRRYSLIRVASPLSLRAEWGDGWHGIEIFRARRSDHWRWSPGRAEINIENPHAQPIHVLIHLTVRSMDQRNLLVRMGDIQSEDIRIGTDLTTVTTSLMTIPAGRSRLRLLTDRPPAHAGPHDQRQLGFAVYGVVIEAVATEVEPIPAN
jgi:hypothetical protein